MGKKKIVALNAAKKTISKKKIFIISAAVLGVVLIVAGAILMSLYIPLHGKQNDGEYWSEYDKFDVSMINSMEVSSDNFKILQLTDLHYHLPHLTKRTDAVVKKLVEQNKPDLIVITGDSVFGPTNATYVKHIVKLMDSFKTPWAIVYGNHDQEGKADKFWMGEKYESSEYSIYQNGPFNIGGTGNYALNLTKGGKPFYNLMMMDSNRVTRMNGVNEYGSFTPSQVGWYEWLSKGLVANGYDASMAFFHIPMPEYLDAYKLWEKSDKDPSMGFGDKEEGVCAAPYNPGMFTKMKEMNITKNVFVGHDHVNNYSIDYQGIRLTYGLKSSGQFYFNEDKVGGTIITIDKDKKVSIEHKYIEW